MKRSPLRRATPLRRKKPLRIRRRKALQDAAFARMVKDRDRWTCQLQLLHRGECRGQLQCCHIFGKQAYPHVRYVFENALTGCAKGHLYGTYRPFEWYEFVRAYLGNVRFDALRVRAMQQEVIRAKGIVLDDDPNDDGSPEERTPSLDAQRLDALRR
jgi:hypothetical protein